MAQPAVSAKRPRVSVEFDVSEFRSSGNYSDEACILGIDEAGRGSVAGPMIYGGALVSLADYEEMTATGVNDSKQLTQEKREAIKSGLKRLKSFVPYVYNVTPEAISEAMLGKRGKNLNTISHECAINIIKEAMSVYSAQLVAVYVDTVGPPATYQRMLQTRFPHIKVTVSSKADAKYPIVGAASIIAKTERDSSIAPEALNGAELGTGYPSDPLAIKFVRQHMHRFFGYPLSRSNIIRQSWRPVVDAVKQGCVPMSFEADEERERDQSKLTFDPPTVGRDPFLTHVLGLRVASTLDRR